ALALTLGCARHRRSRNSPAVSRVSNQKLLGDSVVLDVKSVLAFTPSPETLMTAPDTRGAVPFAALHDLSVDDLGRAIAKHERGMNAQSYQALLLVRAFDERYGWAKWGCASCADWLVWSCGLSLSAARERVRTANALRALPAISAALADGRLSYTKARALT